MENKKVWFITGASKGLGLTLAKKLLSQGYRVAGTSRNMASLTKVLGSQYASFLPLQVDLTDETSIKDAVKSIETHFGTIDVLVNNAGYGQFGTLEELSAKEFKNNYETNVFGLVNVIRNVMPLMRKNQSGHVFNIASLGGYDGNFPGWGAYCSTKFAVAGLTESLAAEVKEFGVKVTLVYPGYFRTGFLSKDSFQLPENPIAAYSAARASEKQHQEQIHGNQPNDPQKFAEVLIEVENAENAPLHLFVGDDAYEVAYSKMKFIETDLENWKAQTLSTGFVEA